MRDILWIYPKWPLPDDDGARKATTDLLRSLCSLGERIHLLALAGEDEKVDLSTLRSAVKIGHVFILRKPNRSPLANILSLIFRPWIPLTTTPFVQHELATNICRILKNNFSAASCEISQSADPLPKRWDAIVYDVLHPAVHSSRFGKFFVPLPGIPTFYRAHNREADIWSRKAKQTKNPPLSLFLSFQAAMVRRLENSVIKNVQAVAAVSEEDLAIFKAAVPSCRGTVVPIGFPFTKPLDAPNDKSVLQIMFLGKLDWPPNRDGLDWFLREVWPEACKKRNDITLAIAGSGDGRWLGNFQSLPNIIFKGRVDSVDSLYQESIASIVPIFYGSGTRVKVIEAARFGRACISTALGVEGVGLAANESFLQAESKEEWIKAILDLTPQSSSKLGVKAFETAKGSFDSLQCAMKFQQMVHSFLP
jgi:glycosyltransferase involved in cell wall biosynthesis